MLRPRVPWGFHGMIVQKRQRGLTARRAQMWTDNPMGISGLTARRDLWTDNTIGPTGHPHTTSL
eukprot:4663188-Lingulodinium_polyedra.AAC.1